MHIRMTITALVGATVLLMAGCSAQVAGSARMATAGSPGSAGATTPTGAGAATATNGDQPDGTAGPTAPADRTTDSGLEPPVIPTFGGDSFPSGIPGMENLEACLPIATFLMSYGTVVLAGMTGAPMTQEQVDSAFAGLPAIPDELKDDIGVLKDAAQQSVGASASTAADILDRPEVESAMDHISDYLEAACGGG